MPPAGLLYSGGVHKRQAGLTVYQSGSPLGEVEGSPPHTAACLEEFLLAVSARFCPGPCVCVGGNASSPPPASAAVAGEGFEGAWPSRAGCCRNQLASSQQGRISPSVLSSLCSLSLSAPSVSLPSCFSFCPRLQILSLHSFSLSELVLGNMGLQ